MTAEVAWDLEKLGNQRGEDEDGGMQGELGRPRDSQASGPRQGVPDMWSL